MVTYDHRDDDSNLYKQHPRFVAEVLSPSTEAFDRGRKFSACRQLDSLQTYWLIDSEKMPVESFTRTENNEWLLQSYNNPDYTFAIASLINECKLQQLYGDAPI